MFKLNDEIFKTKMRNYYDTVFRTCMAYLQNSHDAEDITEEVFITYYYKSPDFENESLEKSWLLKVAVNKCKNLRKCFWKHQRDDDFDYSTLKVYDNKDESVLGEIIAELPDKYRVLILLYYFEEYSLNEISEILGVNISTCQTRLDRARKRIKEKLNNGKVEFLCLKADTKI